MKSHEPPSQSTGPILVNPDQSKLPISLPQKKNSRRKQEIVTVLSPNGSTSSMPKKNSDQEKKNGSQDNLPVPKPLPKPRDRKSEALRRLGVDVLALRSSPEITPMLKNAEGGLKAVLGAMRFVADDPTIAAFLEKYDSTPTCDKEMVSWEAIALAAGIDLRVFLGSAMLALQSQAVNMVKIIAMTSHPKITRARVKYGLLPSGEKDRTALDTAMGFLPSPKGLTFIGKAIFGGSGGEQKIPVGTVDADDGEDEETEWIDADHVDTERLFPSSNMVQQKLIPIRQRMLEDGK
jgi:hypothetical protein